MSEESEIDEINDILKECDHSDLQSIKYFARELKKRTDSIDSKEKLLEISGFKIKDKVKKLIKDYDDLVNNKNKKKFIENEYKICQLLEENENIIKENEELINEIKTLVKPTCNYMFDGYNNPESKLELCKNDNPDEIYMLKQIYYSDCNIREIFTMQIDYEDYEGSRREHRKKKIEENYSFDDIEKIAKSMSNSI